MRCRTCENRRFERPEIYFGQRDLKFSGWAVHQVAHLGDLLHLDLLFFLVYKVGILDAEEEGALVFWRWDFWRGTQRRALKRLKRQGRPS